MRILILIGALLAPLMSLVAQSNYSYRGSTSAEIRSIVGNPQWGALSVEATMRQMSGNGASGLILHYQNSSSFYLFLNSFSTRSLKIFKQDRGWTQLAAKANNSSFGIKHKMRAESDGQGNLKLFWDGNLELTVSDNTYSSGSVGVRSYRQVVDFDDVRVLSPTRTTLLFDDFEDGDANGWSGGTGWSVVWSNTSGPKMPSPSIDTNFEGGNAEVVRIDRDNWTVHLRPELKGPSPYRAWFYFKMSNLSATRPTILSIQNSQWMTKPVYSYDQSNWHEFGSSITLTGDPVWIAQSIPYLTSHQQQLIADLKGPLVQTSLLARSEGGHRVEMLTITDPAAVGPKYGIWLLGRQHAWEASGSWMVDRLARWLVSSDRHAASLRKKATVNIIPIMDVDNVIPGGSGKDQPPIDFNRDWRATPHWNAVAAAKNAIARFAQSHSYDIFIDSHCPGAGTTLYVQPQSMVPAAYWANVQRFRTLFQGATRSAPRPYTGTVTPTGPGYHPQWKQISKWHQFLNHGQLKLSLTLETESGSIPVYDGLALGLGRAMDLFLYRRFGAATAHSVGVPRVDFAGVPIPGNASTSLLGTGLVPGNPILVAVGNPLTPPFPLSTVGGIPGSKLLIDTLFVLPARSTSAGTLSLGLTIPNRASVTGVQVSFQILDLDLGMTQYSLPLGHSGGLTVEVAPK